ncbi:carboxylesterase [Gammaproteobacteria bacterium SCGC AG-212-F23]|nr:carboxylesterase [Gammaproteobacteria bacterium SCGC AG-212-F23]
MIEINPKSAPIGSVIWLHGLGADGNDFVPIIEELRLPEDLPLRFVFPNAPQRPVTINQGYVMRAWYDIVSLDIHQRADATGIRESVKQINAIIENEIEHGIAASKIVLAGFSQGAVVAVHTGLCYPKPLAGIIALSGYPSFTDNFFTEIPTANRHTPVFQAHGTQDTVVPYFMGKMLHDMLLKNHYPTEWHSYPMAHSVCHEETQDISRWLSKIYYDKS